MSRGEAPITMLPGSITVARVYAPYADVNLEGNAHLFGSITAKNITVGRAGRVRFDGNEVERPAEACPPRVAVY